MIRAESPVGIFLGTHSGAMTPGAKLISAGIVDAEAAWFIDALCTTIPAGLNIAPDVIPVMLSRENAHRRFGPVHAQLRVACRSLPQGCWWA